MAITYWIMVRLQTEGLCIHRKEKSEIPRIPDWSMYCEKGHGDERWYVNKPVEIPHEKRWFGRDLYYKAYQVVYWSHRHVELDQWNIPPTVEYLEWIIDVIKPLPNERLIERRLAKEHEEPFVSHLVYYHYKFLEINGKIQAVFESSNEKHYYQERVNGKIELIPIDYNTEENGCL